MSQRIGLTGGLGSGKSTAAAMLAAHGAHILSADEIGRALMQPGTPVSQAIAHHFGPQVLSPDGSLNRPTLARLAFQDGRVEELNAIVHPATIARQLELTEAILTQNPAAIVVTESALIFETKFGDNWRDRFDALILVTAPDWLKIQRHIRRALERTPTADPETLAAEARRILLRQIPDAEKAPECDYIVENETTLEALQTQIDHLWLQLSRH
ncbi:dephospho-CoA kinase [Granulicella tundricola]|uniref:Dephospho-CoA kinase n=1 Tax=Granulicella tundricola (strain ATCC BAA-1859 / DSM 23138 / MP5ACTX9) TaxID=1198114 RepID=E8WXD0_GRATM|nr:dephospho-CoA kinase [Granulicella tundricola]ADW67463.1 dephospho-CoA kinase [Granulicella tundricola MP5ACTX9]